MQGGGGEGRGEVEGGVEGEVEGEGRGGGSDLFALDLCQLLVTLH